jgi:hypothetical protein
MLRSLALFAFLSLLSVPLLAAPQCMVYAGKAFGGASLSVPPNEPLSTLPATLDNSISSVKVAEGCILVGYADPAFKGHTQTWGPGSYAQLPTEWDDVISSAQCNCR